MVSGRLIALQGPARPQHLDALDHRRLLLEVVIHEAPYIEVHVAAVGLVPLVIATPPVHWGEVT